MVICEKYNFNFIRIPKNASSSLAHFFVKNYCNSNDIYTEVNDANIPSNNVPKDILSKYSHQYRFIHLTLQEIVDNGVISKDKAISKQNIGVIRNPLDRQLSLYFFLGRLKKSIRTNSPEEFRSHFVNGYHHSDKSNSILQTDYLKVDGVDYGSWWDYDCLDKHINKFIEEKKAPINTSLQNFKSKIKPENDSLIEMYYDKKTLSAVKKYYEKDFEKYHELTGIDL